MRVYICLPIPDSKLAKKEEDWMNSRRKEKKKEKGNFRFFVVYLLVDRVWVCLYRCYATRSQEPKYQINPLSFFLFLFFSMPTHNLPGMAGRVGQVAN